MLLHTQTDRVRIDESKKLNGLFLGPFSTALNPNRLNFDQLTHKAQITI